MRDFTIRYYNWLTLVQISGVTAKNFASAADYARNNAPSCATRFEINEG